MSVAGNVSCVAWCLWVLWKSLVSELHRCVLLHILDLVLQVVRGVAKVSPFVLLMLFWCRLWVVSWSIGHSCRCRLAVGSSAGGRSVVDLGGERKIWYAVLSSL